MCIKRFGYYFFLLLSAKKHHITLFSQPTTEYYPKSFLDLIMAHNVLFLSALLLLLVVHWVVVHVHMNFILKENAEITQKESHKTITTKISSALYIPPPPTITIKPISWMVNTSHGEKKVLTCLPDRDSEKE